MELSDLLKEQYGIEYGDPLYDIEMKVSMILTDLEYTPLQVNKGEMQADMERLDSIMATHKEKILLLSDGQIPKPELNIYIGGALIELGVPEDEIQRYNGTFNLTKSNLVRLLTLPEIKKSKLLSEFITSLVIYRRAHILHKGLEGFLRKYNPNSFSPNYVSTGHKSGAIITNRPNLTASNIYRYITPSEGKKLVSVEITNQMLYTLANLLQSEVAYKHYLRGDGYYSFASSLYSVPVDEVTTDMRRNVKKFVARNVTGEESIVYKNDFNPISDEYKSLVYQIQSLSTSGHNFSWTPGGRKLVNPKRFSWAIGVSADFAKSVIVSTFEKSENVRLKFVRVDSLYFEVQEDMCLEAFEKNMSEVYKAVTPKGLFAPKLAVQAQADWDNPLDYVEELVVM